MSYISKINLETAGEKENKELKEEFTEEQIVVITAMGVLMVANNYFNDILKIEP
ncbi:carboxymuconolactone decarboxylase family protein [Blautia sp.]|nr:hypothetical protein [uncultured Blautia sp.]